MVSCSSSASRSPSRRSLGTCAATRGHRLRAGGRFSAITSTARRSTSLSCRRLHSKFCLVFVRHGRRLWVSFGVTANPTAEWISRQVTEAFPWDHAPRDLIRDRDTAYGPVFLQRIRAMGIRDHPVAPRSPWQNAYVERLIGSIHPECLDHMIVFGEAHLRRILSGYAAYSRSSSLNTTARSVLFGSP